MDFLDHLNPEQRDAVLHVDGPLLILAGAGSGKTRVIAYRVAYLIGAGVADPGEVLAVTFTNKAAEEMLGRVSALIGAGGRGAWISTFHALCARLLRREAPAIGLSRDFVIYDSGDQLALVKQVLRDLRLDDGVLQPRVALARISQAKNRMEGPETLAGGGYREEQTARVYAQYRQRLTDSHALDFDDLLLKTVQLFDTADRVRARYAQKFRFLMVDEYQDTNRPQYLLVRRLAETHRNLCVVGDPDQSIYKWRGADVRNILDFEQDFPEAALVRLERNYRSTQVILDAASAVISQNRARKDKRLWTDRHGGEKPVYFRANDEIEEADFIARTAKDALDGARELERAARAPAGAGPAAASPGAVLAVLYRTNAQSRVIEDALRRQGLAYKIIGGVRFYERKEIKDALAYLKLLVNPHDDVSLRRVINVPSRGIGKSVMDALDRMGRGPADRPAAPGPNSWWARLERAIDEAAVPPRAAASLRAFRELILGLTEMVAREAVSIAIGKVLDHTGYLQDLRDERSEEADARIENLAELVSAAREYEGREAGPSLPSFIDRLSLLSDADEEEGSADARVWLMTMHSAKGLEFPVVAIAGLEEGLFPHARSSGEDAEIEEERRLCYVAMTRARSRLFLSGAARRRVFGEYRASEPSRFIDEVPAALLERLVAPTMAPHQGYLSPYEFRTRPYGRRGGGVREAAPTPPTPPTIDDYAGEDQRRFGLAPGTLVRHPLFGIGTVLSVEELDDDTKLTVRFTSVGRKRLLARFAKLELA